MGNTVKGTIPEESQLASLRVLQRLHGELRSYAATGLCRPVSSYINELRIDELRHWIKGHLDSLNGRKAEPLSTDLKEFLTSDRLRARAISKWVLERCERAADADWVKDNRPASLEDMFRAEEAQGVSHGASMDDGTIVFGREQLLSFILDNCLSHDLAAPSNKRLLQVLLAAGMGLVFIRFNPAMRESHYHWLLCDLLPKSTRTAITDTLAVPEGAGTIGWVLQDSIADHSGSSASGDLSAPRIQARTLTSTFLDPKGRVAFEDQLVGNRSITAIPVLDNRRKPLGVVFAFFPLEEMFQRAIDAKSDKFFKRFEQAVARSQNELFLSLEVEAATKLYEVSRRRTFASALLAEPKGHTDTVGEKWLKEALAPDDRGIADPLGFQLALEVRQKQGTSGNGSKYLENSVYFRELTFANQLFGTLQLACIYPFRWSPNIVLTLRALHDIYHQYDLDRSPVDTNTEVTSLPTWHYLTDTSIEAGEDPLALPMLDAIYPKSVRKDVAVCRENMSKPLMELKRNVQRSNPQDAVSTQLRVGLDLHSPPNHVVDLVVPLVAVANTKAAAPRWCAGFLRIKCFVPTGLERGQPISSDEEERLQSLYQLFFDNKPALHKIARLFQGFEDCLRGDPLPRLSFENLKTILDLRYVFCKAIARELSLAFNGEARGESLDLALHLIAAKQKSDDPAGQRTRLIYASLAKDAINCQGALKSICDDIRGRTNEGVLPLVTLVSIWLTRTKPIIVNHSSDICGALDQQLFMADRGVANYLDLMLRYSRNMPSTSIELRLDPSHLHGELPGGETIVAPPAFYSPDTERGTLARFDRLVITTDHERVTSQSKLWHQDKGLTIDWRWDRSPEPLAFSLVPGRLTHNLLRNIRRIGSLNLSSTALDLEIDRQARLPLGTVFTPSGDSGDSDRPNSHVRYLNEVVAFMTGDCSPTSEPDWRVAGLTTGEREGVLLAFGHQEESETLARLRETALEGMQADLLRALNAAELAAATKEAERLSWIRHLLYSSFERTDLRIVKIGIHHPEVKEATNRARDQFLNLQALIDCATKRRGNTVLADMVDFERLIRHLWDWYPKAVSFKWNVADVEFIGRPFRYHLACTRVLYMVFANLLDNCIKYVNKDGDGEMRLRCKMTRDREYFVVEVENSGGTMPKEFQQYLEGKRATVPVKTSPQEAPRVPRGLLTVRTNLEDCNLELPHVTAPLSEARPGTRVVLRIPRRDFYTVEEKGE